jgi:predicted transcriptional regulator
MPPSPMRTYPLDYGSLNGSHSQIRGLAEQVSEIALKIARLDTREAPAATLEAKVTSEMLCRMLAARRARSAFFSEGLFADPAWDILLDLLMARLAQREISVSSLCVASNVPATTALRWIKILEGDGLVTKRADSHDGRRFFVELTGKSESAFQQYFASVGLTLVI